MALLRKLFYKKPPDGLLEICERVYVFDCCFTTDAWEEDEYKPYVGGVISQLRETYPDASILVFNFHEGGTRSQIANVLSDHDVTIMDYPRHYEGCPLLSMEVIHHFLRSGESWLSIGQQNVLLMHCERGGWPVLAFMLAALLIYRKQYTGEQKTLDMVYKQAPRELLHLLSPLNPLPSQLRYLQYVSRRNVATEWPPLDRALALDCIILRMIPDFDGYGGCCPIFKIYGQDPFLHGDRTSKLLFSTPKRNKSVRYYKQAECELIKIDINCHIQGDIVLECISLYDGMEREEMMFRVMFNTAFIRSNILMLNRDEIDILWDAKDQFPKDFRAEVLFSEMDAVGSEVPVDLSCFEEKDGLPVEAFAKVQEMFCSVDWLVPNADGSVNVVQKIVASDLVQDKLETVSHQGGESNTLVHVLSPRRYYEKENFAESENKTKISSYFIIEKKYLSPSQTSPRIEHKGEDRTLGSVSESNIPLSPVLHHPPAPPCSLFNNATKQSIFCSPYLQPHHVPACEVTHSSLTGKYDTSIETSNFLLVDPQLAAEIPSFDSIQKRSSLCPPAATSSMSTSFFPNSQEKSTTKTKHSTALPIVPSPFPFSILSSPTTTSEDPVVDTGRSVSPLIHPPNLPEKDMKTIKALPPPPPSPPPPHLTNPLTPPLKEKEDTKIEPALPHPPTPPYAPTRHLINDQSMRTRPPPPPPPPSTLSWVHDQSLRSEMPPLPPPPPTPPLKAKPTLGAGPSPPLPPPPHPPPPPPPTLPLNEKPALGVGSSPPPPPPPPPPPHVGQVVETAVQSSVPPPPPIHNSYLKPMNSTLQNPSIPSAPPPPMASVKGNIKGSIVPPPPPSLSVGGNISSPPPPLFPQTNSKGRLQRTANSKSQQTKKLKPLHWLKLTRAVQGSFWAEAQKSGEASKAPEIDMSELESLFSASNPNSDRGGSSAKSSSWASLAQKPEKVQLIEHRRAYNCEIMLSKVKIPLHELMASVLALEDSALDVDQVDNLIKFCPTKEEMELLKGYKGETDKLGKCEQFFLELMKVPRTESKLRVFSFKLQFQSQVSDLRKNLNIVNLAVEQIRGSSSLKKVMQTILSLGNALNQGTARGSAIGFRLDSLLKLTETRARNNKMTLMHYLCKMLADKLPELLDFSKDLTSLEPASKIQLKYLAEEMQAISKGLEKVVQELSMSENDGPVSENFRKALKEFLCSAEGEVRCLASLYSGVGKKVDSLILYFGEDPARCPYEQVVSTLLNFTRMFKQAHEENCKQVELEKKKAEKETTSEKLKITASHIDSERLKSTPMKSVK